MNKDIPVCSDCHRKAKDTYGPAILNIYRSHTPQLCAMKCGWDTYRRMMFSVAYEFATHKHPDHAHVNDGGSGC